MTENRELVERLYHFGEAIRVKDPLLANFIGRFFVNLLSYDGSLEEASAKELADIRADSNNRERIGDARAGYFVRIFKGESVDTVVESVPVLPKNVCHFSSSSGSGKGDYDGSWDNATRAYEGD